MGNTHKAKIEELKTERPFVEITAQFENRSYFVRSQFLEHYHFKDSYIDYYIDFIVQNALSIKNDNYLSDLVCFTIEFKLFDSRIIDTWYLLLKKSSSVVVKICILDYFNFCPRQKLPVQYVETLSQMTIGNLRKIVKNQLFFNLIAFDERNEKFKILLFKSLKTTKDTRSIIRTISCLNRLSSKKLILEIKEHIKNLNLDFADEKNRSYITDKVSN